MSSALAITEWRGRSRPVEVEVDTGLPVDRTICPACLGQPERADCRVCRGEPVCPMCRGARQYSMPGPRLVYRTCEGCTYPNGEYDQQLQWEGGSTSTDRLYATITAYRAANQHTPPPPTIDPWTNWKPEAERG
jgi:hypothetical protein